MSVTPLNVVHVVDALIPGNHGIVEAALSTAKVLSQSFGCSSELWYPAALVDRNHQFDFRDAAVVGLNSSDMAHPDRFAAERGLSCENTIVVTHGCWRAPTVIGNRLKKAGFRWVYVPHGMLEPWSLAQRSMVKKIYGLLREHPCARRADVVRATAVPEESNLRQLFERVMLVAHGISLGEFVLPEEIGKVRVLFLGRFHPKKNAPLLAEAWLNSKLCDDDRFELLLVGNDDGDLNRLDSVINSRACSNLKKLEPVYGSEKMELFNDCQFFVLPSHSEGFPVALLEGMAAGLIPIISSGCNLPEALDSGLAIPVSPDLASITEGLNSIAELSTEVIRERQAASRELIRNRYSLQAVAGQQAALYQSFFD